MAFIKYIQRYLMKATLYATAFGLIGAVFSFVKGWPLLRGGYIFVLGGGIITMIIAMALLIGTPSMRKSMFSSPERRREPQAGAEGIGVALMGICIIIIGFWLESQMHR